MVRHVVALIVVFCICLRGQAQPKRIDPAATYRGHKDAARAVAFSPDGNLLASGSDDHTIIIWDLEKGKPRALLEGHRTSIWNLEFSPDGSLLASGIGQPSQNRASGWDFSIKLWDVRTGKPRRNLEGCTGNVFAMAFSPDGKFIAACDNGRHENVKLWEVNTGKFLGNPTPENHARSLAFRHDGKVLAVAGHDRIVELWDVANNKRHARFELADDITGGVSFSRDDKMLAVGTRDSVTICDAATGKRLKKLEGAQYFPEQVLFTPDAKHLAAANWFEVILWEAGSGREAFRFRFPWTDDSGQIGDIALNREGSLLAAANGSQVTVWSNPTVKPSTAAPKSGSFGSLKTNTPSTSKKERDSDFRWFSELSYPDPKSLQFVKVYTNVFRGGGSFSFTVSSDSDKPTATVETSPVVQQSIFGFLVDKGERSFRVLNLGLETETFEIDPKVQAKDKSVRFEHFELESYAYGYLKELRKPRKEELSDREKGPSLRMQVFVLAWACWQRGLDGLAADLHQEAARLPFAGNQLSTRSARELVADDLAEQIVLSILSDSSRREVTREAMLQRLDAKAKHLPELANHEGVRVLKPMLAKMIEEDTEYAKRSTPFAKLTQEQQIADLIFQLRDQGGFSPPRNFIDTRDFFKDPIDDRIDPDYWRNQPGSPAQRLVKFGTAAAGPLIEHLNDDRLTRSMTTGFWSNRISSHHDVLRVGDCAALILERISGRNFRGENRMPAEVKRRAVEWFDSVSSKGEMQTLSAGVRRGDGDSYVQSLRLVEKYANDALPAIAAGIAAAKDDNTRRWLLRAAGRLKESEALLRTELKENPSPFGRLEAARILFRMGHSEAVPGMIALWKNVPLTGKSDDEREHASLLTEIADNLIATRHPNAIDAMTDNLPKRQVGVRQSIVRSCSSALSPAKFDIFGPRNAPEYSPEARRSLERILLMLLDDTEKDEYRFPSTRTCDDAATAFSQVSPKLYPFNPDASIAERDAAIRVIKVNWQKNKEGD